MTPHEVGRVDSSAREGSWGQRGEMTAQYRTWEWQSPPKASAQLLSASLSTTLNRKLAGREGRRACRDTGASGPAGLHAEAGAQRG